MFGWRLLSEERRDMLLFLIGIIIGSVALDQLTKWLAVIYLQGEPSFPLWQDVLHFTFVKTEGAAFGMLKDHRWVFMIFSTVAIIGMLIYLFAFRPKSKLMQITLAAVIGGGIGNMIDRVALGYVIDFIDFTLKDFAVFNIADCFVTVGAFAMIALLIIETDKEEKNERLAKAAWAEKEVEEAEEETTPKEKRTDSAETQDEESVSVATEESNGKDVE